MKKFINIIKASTLVILMFGCEQEILNYTREEPETPTPETPEAGTADFSKFVAVGNSLVAGFQNAALYSDGQSNSLPLILNKQFQMIEGAQGGGEFNQPDINSENGYSPNLSVLPDQIYGKLQLKGSPASPVPSEGELPTAYEGDKANLNNFGVPGIVLGQLLTPATGTPGNAIENGYYTRFASQPGTSTIIGDAAAAQGTFFLLWIGNNDVLAYATSGGAGTIGLTTPENFTLQYTAALQALTAGSDRKGVIGNIPDITSIPYFTLVPYNPITFSESSSNDATIVTLLNQNYQSYNAGIAGALSAGMITSEEAAARNISFDFGDNPLVVTDETLTTITLPDGQGGTVTLPNIRQMISVELVTLPAASLIGTPKDPNNPLSIWGLAEPLTDRYILIKPELDSILTSINEFNMAIDNAITNLGLTDRIAVADIRSTLSILAEQSIYESNVVVTSSFAPPYGGFSLDGVHPNSRGYALAANTFIDAINRKFNAKVPMVNLGEYSGTALPIP